MKFLFSIITAIALMIPIGCSASDKEWVCEHELGRTACYQTPERTYWMLKGVNIGLGCFNEQLDKYLSTGERVIDMENCIKKRIKEYTEEED